MLRIQARGLRGRTSPLPGARPTLGVMSPAEPIRLVLADDHPVYRSGLVDAIAQRPEFVLLAACADGRTARDAILAERPDAALLDVRMPDPDGIAVLEAVRAAGCRTRVLFLSAYEDGALVHRALSAGAAGYLSKDTDRDEIATRSFPPWRASSSSPRRCRARSWATCGARASGASASGHANGRSCASPPQGLSGPEIADALGIGPATVKTYIQRVYRKLGVADRAAMVAEAMRRGLVA